MLLSEVIHTSNSVTLIISLPERSFFLFLLLQLRGFVVIFTYNTWLLSVFQDDITVGNELRQAAFRVYASLCANNEDVRKQVSNSENCHSVLR